MQCFKFGYHVRQARKTKSILLKILLSKAKLQREKQYAFVCRILLSCLQVSFTCKRKGWSCIFSRKHEWSDSETAFARCGFPKGIRPFGVFLGYFLFATRSDDHLRRRTVPPTKERKLKLLEFFCAIFSKTIAFPLDLCYNLLNSNMEHYNVILIPSCMRAAR